VRDSGFTHKVAEGMDNAEKSDICSKTLRIFILELDVVQRSSGGNLGETEE